MKLLYVVKHLFQFAIAGIYKQLQLAVLTAALAIEHTLLSHSDAAGIENWLHCMACRFCVVLLE